MLKKRIIFKNVNHQKQIEAKIQNEKIMERKYKEGQMKL